MSLNFKRDIWRTLSRFRNVSMFRIATAYCRAFLLHFRKSAVRNGSTNGRDIKIVVTLTTIPSRLKKIIPVLHSLIDQDSPATAIILAVPWHSLREETPYSETVLQSLPDCVTILRCDDLGPATKLLPALKEMPDAVLIVVDDDVIYPKNFITTLLASHQERPDVAFGYRGVSLKEEIDFANLEHVFGTGVGRVTSVDILFGTWGYLIPPGALSDEVHDYSGYPDEVRWVDDVWISGHLAKRGVPRYVMPASDFPVETLASFTQALTDGKNRSGKNDQIAIDVFQPYWGHSEYELAEYEREGGKSTNDKADL